MTSWQKAYLRPFLLDQHHAVQVVPKIERVGRRNAHNGVTDFGSEWKPLVNGTCLEEPPQRDAQAPVDHAVRYSVDK
jgi:hypothetical protein